jgi:hypothetical protein
MRLKLLDGLLMRPYENGLNPSTSFRKSSSLYPSTKSKSCLIDLKDTANEQVSIGISPSSSIRVVCS